KFRCDDKLITFPGLLHNLADEFLRTAGTIKISRVYEVNAVFNCSFDEVLARLFIKVREKIMSADCICTQSYRINVQIRFTNFNFCFHNINLPSFLEVEFIPAPSIIGNINVECKNTDWYYSPPKSFIRGERY